MAAFNFGQEQIGNTYTALNRRQKKRFPTTDQFVGAVQAEQVKYPSDGLLNQDVAIGNVLMQQEQADRAAARGGLSDKTGGITAPMGGANGGAGGGADTGGPAVTEEAIKEMIRMGITDPASQVEYLNQNSGGQRFSVNDLTSKGVVTSGPANALYGELDGRIAGLQEPNLLKADPRYAIDLINQRKDVIDQTLKSQLQSIENAFQVRSQSQVHTNRQREGGLKAFLASSGALSSGSGQSMFNAQVMASQQALSELDFLKQNLIQQAQNARDSQDLELMQETMEMYDKVREQSNTVEQQMFDNRLKSREFTLKEQGELRDQQQQDMNFQLSALQALPADKFDEVDPQVISEMEMKAGLPAGYFKLFNDARKEAGIAENEQGRLNSSLKVLEMALKMPAGTSFDLPLGPNGEAYTVRGLDVGANKIFQTEDNAGNVFFTTIDPTTGKILSSISGGAIGKAVRSQVAAGYRGISSDVLAMISQAIPLIGQDGTTAQEVMQLLLAEPSIAGDKVASDMVIDIVTNINKIGEPPRLFTTTVETGVNKQPVSVVQNPQTGEIISITPISVPEQESGSGEGFFSTFWKTVTGENLK